MSTYDTHVNNVIDYLFESDQDPFPPRYKNFFNVHAVESDLERVRRGRASGRNLSRYGARRLLLFPRRSGPRVVRERNEGQGRLERRFVRHRHHGRHASRSSSTIRGTAAQVALGDGFAVFSGVHTAAPEIFIHEEGHSFAALLDEYDYGGGDTYTGSEPSVINVTKSSTGAKWSAWQGVHRSRAFQFDRDRRLRRARRPISTASTGPPIPRRCARWASRSMPSVARASFARSTSMFVHWIPIRTILRRLPRSIPELLVDVVDTDVIKMEWSVKRRRRGRGHRPELPSHEVRLRLGEPTRSRPALTTRRTGSAWTAPCWNRRSRGPVKVTASPEIVVLDGITNIRSGQSAPIDFGIVGQGAASPSKTFTIRNDGEMALTVVTPLASTAHFTVRPARIERDSFRDDHDLHGDAQNGRCLVGQREGYPSPTTTATTATASESPFTFFVRGAVVVPGPEITVLDGSSIISDGQTTADRPGHRFSRSQRPPARPFTIRNDGLQTLTLNSGSFADTAHFTVSQPGVTSLATNQTTTFTVTLKTGQVWTGTETISLGNNDEENGNSVEIPFNFLISGNVIPTSPRDRRVRRHGGRRQRPDLADSGRHSDSGQRRPVEDLHDLQPRRRAAQPGRTVRRHAALHRRRPGANEPRRQ